MISTPRILALSRRHNRRWGQRREGWVFLSLVLFIQSCPDSLKVQLLAEASPGAAQLFLDSIVHDEGHEAKPMYSIEWRLAREVAFPASWFDRM